MRMQAWALGQHDQTHQNTTSKTPLSSVPRRSPLELPLRIYAEKIGLAFLVHKTAVVDPAATGDQCETNVEARVEVCDICI